MLLSRLSSPFMPLDVPPVLRNAKLQTYVSEGDSPSRRLLATLPPEFHPLMEPEGRYPGKRIETCYQETWAPEEVLGDPDPTSRTDSPIRRLAARNNKVGR